MARPTLQFYMAGVAAIALATPVWAQDAPPATSAVAAPNISPTQPSDAPNQTRSATPQVASGATAAADQNVLPADIVVTAQKRAERLQDVPLAVSVVTGDALAQRQINDTSSLVQAIPSLTFQQGNNPTNTTFRIRGVGTSLFNQGVESAVSVVIDGVVQARQAQSFADFADIERVEVLRGPQGTLFGKNSTAGVINVVTARPSRTFSAKGSVTVAEEGEYRASGTASGPISDTLRVGVTGYYNHVGGYIANLKTGEKDNGSEGWGVRGKLDWDATDTLNFLLSAEYRKSDANCCETVLVKANNPARLLVAGPVRVAPDADQVWTNGQTYSRSHQQTYSLQGDLDLGAASLTSITAYQRFSLGSNYEVDRFGFDVPVYIGTGASALFNENYGTVTLGNFTQELRIASTGSRRFTYVAGLFYSNLWLDRDFQRRRAVCSSGTVGQPCAASATTYQSLASHARLNDDSISSFGQAEWEFIDKLKLIAGARVQYQKVSVTGQQLGVIVPGDAVFGPPASAVGTRSADDTAITGKAGLQYEMSRNAQVYASYTRGYKGLGFDTEVSASFATQSPVEPEHVNAYEIGFKGQTPDRVFSIATALFLADYDNLQIQANRTDPTTGVPNFVQTNAGSSQTKGFEIEFTVHPDSNFSLNGGVTYSKTRVDVNGLSCPSQYQIASVSPTIPIGGTRPVNSCYRYQFSNSAGALATSGYQQDVRGGILPASPEWRVTVGPRYEHDLGSQFRGFAQADLTYQSDQIFGIEQDPLSKQDGYALVDLSFGVRQIDSRYSVTFFVKNLFDTNYYTSLGTSALFSNNLALLDLYAQRPKNADRYVGGTVGFKF